MIDREPTRILVERARHGARAAFDCIWIEGAGRTVVRNNLVRDNRYHGTGNCTGTKLYRCRAGTDRPRGECIIEDNEIHNVNLAYFDKARGSWRNTFRRNLVYNVNGGVGGNLGGGESAYAMVYGNLFIDNIGVGITQAAGRDHLVCNNTLAPQLRRGADYAALLLRGEDRLEFYSNILDSVHIENVQGLRRVKLVDLNCFLGQPVFWMRWGKVADGSLGAWREDLGFDRHSIVDDGQFVDEEARDFRLKPGSPCIDKGRPVTFAVGAGHDSEAIAVANACAFTDGNGIVAGDMVQIEEAAGPGQRGCSR